MGTTFSVVDGFRCFNLKLTILWVGTPDLLGGLWVGRIITKLKPVEQFKKFAKIID